jgi:hypothetical protein
LREGIFGGTYFAVMDVTGTKSGAVLMNFFPKCRLLSNFSFLFALVAVGGLPLAVAQEGQEQPTVSQEDIEQYEELKELAKEKRIDAAVQENKTGTDPRD